MRKALVRICFVLAVAFAVNAPDGEGGLASSTGIRLEDAAQLVEAMRHGSISVATPAILAEFEAIDRLGQGDWQVISEVDSNALGTSAVVSIQRGLVALDLHLVGSQVQKVTRGEARASYFAQFERSGTLLDLLPPSTHFSVLSLESCRNSDGTEDRDILPLASVSKILLAGAVSDMMRESSLGLDETWTLEEADLSAGSGTWHHLPRGTKVSVEDALHTLLVRSDNTAFDALIRYIGIAEVEEQVAPWNSHPEGVFLRSKELIHGRWTESLSDVELTSATRESFAVRVDGLPPPTLNGLEPPEPLRSQWAWYSSATHICEAWRSILVNPSSLGGYLLARTELDCGLPDCSRVYTKAGFDPGVYFSSWVVCDNCDGSRLDGHVVNFAVIDEWRRVDLAAAEMAGLAALRLSLR